MMDAQGLVWGPLLLGLMILGVCVMVIVLVIEERNDQ